MPTILAAGDIAFTAFQSDNAGGAGGDFFEFVLLKDVVAGTTIFFTDGGYDTSTGKFSTSENVLRWVAQTDLTAGTKVSFTSPGGDGAANTAEWTGINPATGAEIAGTKATQLGLSTSGDQITALVSTSFGGAAALSGTAIAAINFGAATYPDVMVNPNSNSTGLPFGLIDGITAISVGNVDNGRYNPAAPGSVETGTAEAIRQSVNNDANFEVSEAVLSPAATEATFVVQTAEPAQAVIFAAGSVAIAHPEGNAGLTSFTFTVERSGGTSGDVNFSGQITSVTASGSDFAGTPAVPFAFSGTIPAGQTSAQVTVSVSGDTTVEPDESFTLTLQTVSNSNAAVAISIGTQASASGTIQNDDAALGNVINGIAILDQAPSLHGATVTPTATDDVTLVRLGNYAPRAGTNAEVVSFDPTTGQAYVLNTIGDSIDVVAISASGAVSLVSSIDLTKLDDFGGANSVAIKNGVLAVAYAGEQPGGDGHVALFDRDGTLLNTVDVGAGPDQLVFTADGLRILVANEGEPVSVTLSGGGTQIINPYGSVSILDLSAGASNASVATTVSFDLLDGHETQLKQAGVALLNGQVASADIEPEYIALSPDGSRAYVTLQEVDAVAVIDLTNPSATQPLAILPLGGVDHALAGNAFDGSDKDKAINLRNADVIGLLQPDAIATFSVGGATYFVTANEGDARVALKDEAKLSELVLDPTAYPDASTLRQDAVLGRLRVRSDLGDTDGDHDIDQIYAYGGRSISIFQQNADGTITKVRETGGEFEAIIASIDPARFNIDTAEGGGADSRSDNKGPEPEGVDIGVIDGRTYAFVGLERVGGVMIYDVTDPANASFVGYRPPLSGEGNAPEVTKFVSAAQSPTGTALVLTANEGNSEADYAGSGLTIYAALPKNYTQEVRIASTSTSVSHAEGNAGTTAYSFVIERTNGTIGTVDVTLQLASGAADGADFAGGAALPKTLHVTIPAGAASASVTVDVAGDTSFERDESFTLTVTGASTTQPGVNAAVSATQTVATAIIANDDAPQIGDIQGTGHVSAYVGQTVSIQGTVTAIDTNGSRGFYIQDADGDGNAATSDGIFIFTNAAPTVSVGQLVKVTGSVAEYVASGAAPGSLSTTEIISPSIEVLGTGPAVTATVIGGPGGLVPPSSDLAAGSLFYESLEGMLVEVTAPVAVGPTNSYGEIETLANNGADSATPRTERGGILLSQGAPSFGNSDTVGGDFNPERIQIDDDNGILPGFVTPKVNVGAQLSDVTGIVNYDFGNYQVVATQAYTVTQPSTLVKESTTLTKAVDQLLVASYNAENLDPSDGAARFASFAQQILTNLNTPDIVALQEIQDNSGATDNGVTSASTTLQMLVDALNAASGSSGPHYAYIDNPFIGNDSNGGEPGGNIRNAFVYNTDRVSFVANSLQTMAADGRAISDPSLASGQQTNPDHPFFDSRPPLSATFTFNGEEVTVINNHFTSKGGSGALYGSAQPPINGGEVQRAAQAQAVNTYVDGLLAGDPGAKVIVTGDLNDFDFESPLAVIKGTATVTNYDTPARDPFDATATYTPGGTAVLTDLNETLPANQRYDYVFEGNSESLDHMLATASLTTSAKFDIVHVNSEFADQSSDHDPLVASFTITPPAPQTYRLQLLHFSDAEAGLLASETAPNLAALVDAFDDQYGNTLILSGGDNFLPGPFVAAGTDLSVTAALNAATGSTIGATANLPIAAADIAILNAIGVEASAIGNHEFDLGSKVLRDAITPGSVAGYSGANFVYLSSNLDFSGDSDLSARYTNTVGNGAGVPTPEASTLKGKIAPAAVVTEGGEKIGLIGITTQMLEAISSPTGTEVKGFPTGPGANGEFDNMTLLAAQIQPIIDELMAEGVNKIVLQSHLQLLGNEQSLATKLSGVDIILAAGSHTRLADADDTLVAFPGHSANAADSYPLVTKGADGGTTLIVSTDGEYTYLGRLVVDFDNQGHIVPGSVTANQSINGAYAATAQNVAKAWGTTVENLAGTAFADGTKGDKVEDLTNAVHAVINVKDGNVFGYTDVYLEGERAIIRNQETNLGDLSADANAAVLRDALGDVPFIVSLKNGGGVRAAIGTVSNPDPVTGEIDKLPPAGNPTSGKPEGGVSQLDIENSLRFDNKLMAFDTTVQGLLNILNWGAGLSANNGGFPQIGGVAYSYDPKLPGNSGAAEGSRIRDVALIDEHGNTIVKLVDDGVVLHDVPAVITVISLNFTANGGDGYPTKANGENFRYVLADGTLSAAVDETLDLTAPATFASVGITAADLLGEQKAFANYMTENHGTKDTAYDHADTPQSGDLRIQNQAARTDTVLKAEAVVLTGGAGDDTLKGGALNDTLTGNGGIDTLFGYGGDDLMRGGGGNDHLYGGPGRDVLLGGAGADMLSGGEQDDQLEGGRDNDDLVGGTGSDTYSYEFGDGSDTIIETASANDTDVLLFQDIKAASAKFQKHGDDTQILLADGSVITLKGQLAGGGIEKVVFADGRELDRGGIVAAQVNRGPLAADDKVADVAEDAASFIVSFADILGNDTDADLDKLSLTGVLNAVGGTAELVAGVGVRFTPAANFNGAASFEYIVDDGRGGTDVGAVRFGVTAVNDAPAVIAPFAATTDEDKPLLGQIIANDVDGDTLSYEAGTAQHGSVSVDAQGRYVYTPNADFNGQDSFVIKVSDGIAPAVDAVVNVTVAAVNDAPAVIAPLAATTDEDKPLLGQIIANDVDGDTLSYQAGAAQHGSVSVDAQGRYVYTPNVDFNGQDGFVIKVSDGIAPAVDAVVNVTVAPVNDAPVTVDDTASVGENQSKAFDLTGNDSDIEDGVPPHLTGFEVTGVSGIDLSAAKVQSAFAIDQSGQLQFTPGALFDGLNTGDNATISVRYTAEDSAHAAATGNFTLTVVGETDANVMTGTNGTNLLLGTEGVDAIDAKGGSDFVFGQGGDDIVHAGAGNDFVFGGSGNDQLFGQAGRDTLFGDGGDDTLVGGAGNDLLYGGGGSDTFVFHPGDGRDIVFDFNAGKGSDDVLQLDASVFADFDALMHSSAVSNTATGTEIAYADGSSITLLGVSKASLTVDDFRFA